MKEGVDYTVQSFPSSRKFTMDAGWIGLRKHHVKALIEIDITEPRIKIRNRRALPGEKVSFTSWILKCIARAIHEHRQAHAFKKGAGRLILFNNIDLSVIIEKEVDGTPVPLPVVIRDVESKSVADIFSEIETAKKAKAGDDNSFVIGRERGQKLQGLFSLIPQPIRLMVWKIALRNPFRVKMMMGTAVVTSVGMMGNADGWILPFSIHPVCFALGSITKKPGVVQDAIAIREYLKMTVLIDHDVIDGAPAARFVSLLADLIRNGYSL
jgi:pyruvate/2-oxoglutarate dehydrogenase complex dihydrolipoamide acyltransferase (E2) component